MSIENEDNYPTRADLHAEIDRLRERVAELEGTDPLRSQVESLTTQLAAVKTERDELKAAVEAMTLMYADQALPLWRRLASSETANRYLRGVRETLKGRVEKLEQQLATATSPVPGLADSGPYTLADVEAIEKHRGKPYSRMRETVEQLDAATADAARAELRVREIVLPALRLVAKAQGVLGQATMSFERGEQFEGCIQAVRAALAADADSDARLREVMGKAVFRAISCGESRGAAGIFDDASKENDAKFIVNEVLGGVKP